MIAALYLVGRYPATAALLASWEPGEPAVIRALEVEHWLITYRVWAGRSHGVKSVPRGSEVAAAHDRESPRNLALWRLAQLVH